MALPKKAGPFLFATKHHAYYISKMATALFPIGYGSRLVSLEELILQHSPNMESEFCRRLFAWLESKEGLIGIGGGWRRHQPDKAGFAPEGKSFHQSQVFSDGTVAYMAVDLVARNPGNVHRAPTWAESEDAPLFGLHTFIANESWHLQPIEIRGWQAWVNAGRPRPDPNFKLPNQIPKEREEIEVKPICYRNPAYQNVFMISPAGIIHLSPATYDRWKTILGEPIVENHAQTLKMCLHQCGLTTADLVKV